MADAGIGEIALVALIAASTAYSGYEAAKKPTMPNEPTAANLPTAATASPDVNVATQNQIAQQQAQSVAGTSMSPNNEGPGGTSNDPLTPRKSLLGT